MHFNGFGDSLQFKRPQMADAVSQETVLQAHNLARHFQDRGGPHMQ